MTAVELINDLAMLISECGDKTVVIAEDNDKHSGILAPFFVQSKDHIVIVRNKHMKDEQQKY